MIKGEITVEKDDHELYPWTATFETEEHGTFFTYGRTKEEAINKMDKNVKDTINAVQKGDKK